MLPKILAVAGAAAILTVCLLGGGLLNINGKETTAISNPFVMTAYAADGSEIASSGEGVGLFTITDHTALEKLKSLSERSVEFNFIGDTIKTVDINTPLMKLTLNCLDDDGNPIAKSQFKMDYPEHLTEDFTITATAHFLDGTTETKTVTIPAE